MKYINLILLSIGLIILVRVTGVGITIAQAIDDALHQYSVVVTKFNNLGKT